MKSIHFYIEDTFDKQITDAILRLGFSSKSDFFRTAARHFIEEKVPVSSAISTTPVMPVVPPLSKEEALVMGTLRTHEKTIDEITIETGLHVSKVSSLLVQLLLKKLARQDYGYWKLPDN